MGQKLANDSMQNLYDFYINFSDEKSTKNKENEIIQIFEKNYSMWERKLGRLFKNENVDDMVGSALCIYSAILDVDALPTLNCLNDLYNKVQKYEHKVKYRFNLKAGIYNNLANMYAKIGSEKDSIQCFKKNFFYLFSELNKTIYSTINCFAFHSLSKHMLHSFSENTLNVSSPLKFNDIFDCPLINLLNNDEGPSKLRRRALCDCVKIACFDRNIYLPTEDDLVFGKKRKKNNDEHEYDNELLWSHYTDYHKGICIEYVFDSKMFKSAQNSSSIVSFFKDVNYCDNLDSIKTGTSIAVLDGFFAKSKAWRYENELRFFYFDLNGSGDYDSIKIPKCIKSITFGAQCPENDKILVMKLMRGYKYRDVLNAKTMEKKIEFYQMKPDENVFGKIKREPIALNKGKILVQ